jgi:hypothetical protein
MREKSSIFRGSVSKGFENKERGHQLIVLADVHNGTGEQADCWQILCPLRITGHTAVTCNAELFSLE